MTKGMNLETQRAEMVDKLSRLKMSPEADRLVREADTALENYRREIAIIESAIAGLDMELGTRERDRRAAEAEQRRSQWFDQRQQLVDAEEQRLAEIEDAEAATRALADAISRIIGINKRMIVLARDLSSTKKVPSALNEMELVNRIARRIAAVMSTVPGRRHRFGHIEWHYTGQLEPEDSWRTAEESYIAREVLGPLLQEGKAD